MSFLFPKAAPKASPQEIKEAGPLRKKARERVIDQYNEYKKLISVLKEANIPSSVTRSATVFFDSEISWWNNNLEISPLEVEIRLTKYTESREIILKNTTDAFLEALKQFPSQKAEAILSKFPDPKVQAEGRKTIDSKSGDEKEKEESRIKAIEDRTVWHDITDSLKIVTGSIFMIITVILAFRWSAFSANSILYKPIPYRALNFVYVFFATFLYFPIVFSYNIYKEIAAYVWPATNDTPLYEGVFPVNSYELGEERTLSKRFFGYANTDGIKSWFIQKQNEYDTRRLDALKNTSHILEKLVAIADGTD